GAAFVGLKVTEGDVAQLALRDEACHRFPHLGKHAAQSGMHEQRFIVAHQEVVELQVCPARENRDTKHIGCDFLNGCHSPPRAEGTTVVVGAPHQATGSGPNVKETTGRYCLMSKPIVCIDMPAASSSMGPLLSHT